MLQNPGHFFSFSYFDYFVIFTDKILQFDTLTFRLHLISPCCMIGACHTKPTLCATPPELEFFSQLIFDNHLTTLWLGLTMAPTAVGKNKKQPKTQSLYSKKSKKKKSPADKDGDFFVFTGFLLKLQKLLTVHSRFGGDLYNIQSSGKITGGNPGF